jgi:hypothetical protein
LVVLVHWQPWQRQSCVHLLLLVMGAPCQQEPPLPALLVLVKQLLQLQQACQVQQKQQLLG